MHEPAHRDLSNTKTSIISTVLETGSTGHYTSLQYHFGDSLPTQPEALLAWVEYYLLMRESCAVDDVLQAMRRGEDLPYAIDIETQEMAQIVELGIREDRLRSEQENCIALTMSQKQRLEEAAQAAKRREQVAENLWYSELTEVYPELTKAVVAELWEGLWRFSALLSRRYAQRLRSLDSNGAEEIVTEIFPKDHPLYSVAVTEYPKFVLSDDADKRWVLARQLSHVLYTFRTSVSESAAAELRGSLSGRALYLDTNVLLPALGLTGDSSYEVGITQVLALAQAAGFKLMYTAETRTEFAATMRKFLVEFGGGAGTDIAPNYVIQRQQPSLARAFFRSRSTDYLSIQEFYERYHDLDALARAHSNLTIELEHLYDAHDERIRNSSMFERALVALRNVDRGNYGEPVLNHDAYHFALIDYARDSIHTYTMAKSWFLTLDTSLLRVDASLGFDVPIAMTLDTWVLTFRQFLPRVNDFEDFMTSVLSRALLPGFYIDTQVALRFQEMIASDTHRSANEVIGRIVRTSTASKLARTIETSDISELAAAIETLAKSEEQRRSSRIGYVRDAYEADVERLQKQHQTEISRLLSKNTEAIGTLVSIQQLSHSLEKAQDELERQNKKLAGAQNLLRLANSRSNTLSWVITVLALIAGLIFLPRLPWPSMAVPDPQYVIASVLTVLVWPFRLCVLWLINLAKSSELRTLQENLDDDAKEWSSAEATVAELRQELDETSKTLHGLAPPPVG